MKSEPTCERFRAWIGVTDDHSQFIAEGNPNPGYENLRLTTFDSLLSFGNILWVANRYTMQVYCKKWNDIIRKTKVSDPKRVFVHPEKAEFALTIPFDGRRRK
ncbi:MAG: hypothetical protein PUF61_11075 [Spirochaetales bacterium]|nr:hypothetical protein [Spirochaetales bacterium]